MAGCPSSHQPTRIREETLESGGPLQRKLNFRLRTSNFRLRMHMVQMHIQRHIHICPYRCTFIICTFSIRYTDAHACRSTYGMIQMRIQIHNMYNAYIFPCYQISLIPPHPLSSPAYGRDCNTLCFNWQSNISITR